MNEIKELLDSKAAFLTDNVTIVFRNDPDLKSIAEARKLLDQITDQLIKDKLWGLN
jgi:hypothetical protein